MPRFMPKWKDVGSVLINYVNFLGKEAVEVTIGLIGGVFKEENEVLNR